MALRSKKQATGDEMVKIAKKHLYILCGLLAMSSSSLSAQPAGGVPAAPQAVRQGGGGPGGLCNAPCDPYPGRKKLLVIADVQSGFHHTSINHTMAVIDELGRKSGEYVTFLRTDSQLITKSPIKVSSARYAHGNTNIRNLDYFDAVFFLGSGEGTMSDQQKADLVSAIHDDGKGLILGHAQGVNFYNWPEWGQMIGGFMASEYPVTGMNAKVVDPSWKAAAAFGKGSFFWADQWPVLKPDFKPGSVHTIMALDPAKMTPEQLAKSGRADSYYPIVWAKMYGKGRVFNLTGGHRDDFVDEPRNRALLLEGIEWVLGLHNENVSPDRP